MGFPGGSERKESACNAGDLCSTPGSGRSPGEGNDYPFQYSCLENPKDGGAWWAAVYGVTQSRTQKRRSSSSSSSSSSSFNQWKSLVTQMVKNLPTMQEIWVQSLSQKDPLEKEMTTHSSTLTWRIPWTEKTGGLYSKALCHPDYLFIYLCRVHHAKCRAG